MTLPTFERRTAKAVNPWCQKSWPDRRSHIAGVMIHATRSGRSAGDDGPGTENWLGHPSNGSAAQDWGSSWDALIYESGLQVITHDVDKWYASWCAGYGDAGTWPAGLYYVMVEVSQGRPEDHFTEAELHSAAQYTAEASQKYGFPLVKIPFLTQRGTPPRGICSHEDSANGKKLGKSDPGPMWPWERFLGLCRQYAGEEEEMTDDELKEALKRIGWADDLGPIDVSLRNAELARWKAVHAASDPNQVPKEK